jgi:hypothetical protein
MNLLDQLLRDPLDRPPPLREIWSPDVKTIDVDNLRVYQTPDGNYPSVTSVLGAISDDTWLKEWRDRIGHDAAERISQRSRDRGTRMHAALEAAIRRERKPMHAAELDTEALIMARRMAERLFPRITEVLALEAALWSNRLRIAGRTDCVAIVDGRPTLVDFKNARRRKTREDVHGYFRQTALYASMFLERTGIPVTRLLVGVALADDMLGEVILFEEDTADWLPSAIDCVRQFDQLRGRVR